MANYLANSDLHTCFKHFNHKINYMLITTTVVERENEFF